jgi:hypothetical protein
MQQIQAAMTSKVNENIGFWGTIGTALTIDTITGEFISDMDGVASTNGTYEPTDKEREYFASDIPKYVVDRIADVSTNKDQFLYELQQARISIRRRNEMMSGGTLGAVGGFSASMLAMGGEAVAITLLGGAIFPTLAAVGGAATVAGRVRRGAGAVKGLVSNLAVDVPLEMTRYELDKTMTPTDVMIGLGASAVLGSAVGAWKPHMYLRPIQNMSEVAARRKAADALRRAGDEKAAKALEDSVNPRVRVVPHDEDVEDLASMPLGHTNQQPGSLRSEAKARGVKEDRVVSVESEVDLESEVLIGGLSREESDLLDGIFPAGTKADVRVGEGGLTDNESLFLDRVFRKEGAPGEGGLTSAEVGLLDTLSPRSVLETGFARVGDGGLTGSEANFLKVVFRQTETKKAAPRELLVKGEDIPGDIGGTVTAGSRADLVVNRRLLSERSPELLQRMEAWFNTYLRAPKYARESASFPSPDDAAKGFTAEEAQLARNYGDALKRAAAIADAEEGGIPLKKIRAELKLSIKLAEEGKGNVKRGVKVRKPEIIKKTAEELRADLLAKRRADQPKSPAVRKQVDRDWAALDDAGRAREARRVGVDENLIKRGSARALLNAVKKATVAVARTGQAVVQSMGGLPYNVKLNKAISITPDKGKGAVSVAFASPLEAMLNKLATAKGGTKKADDARQAIIDWFKEAGVEDPVALARQFRDELRNRARLARNKGTTTLVADSKNMSLAAAVRVAKDGSKFTPKLGQHLFEQRTKQSVSVRSDLYPNSNVKRSEVTNKAERGEMDQLSAADEAESVVTGADGEIISVGPTAFIGLDPEKLAAREASQYGIQVGAGFRENLATSIDSLEAIARHWNAPKWLQSAVGKFDYLFTGVTSRVMGGKTAIMRKFVAVMLDDPRGLQAHSVTSAIKANTEAASTRLHTAIKKANMEAHRAGQTLTDLEVVRAVRSGEKIDLDSPLGKAVEAVRKFHREILEHGKSKGVFSEGIPADDAYFHRQWNPIKLRRIIETRFKGDYEAGAKRITQFIAKAILKKNETGVNESQARRMAERIFDYIGDPTAKNDWQATRIMFANTKEKLKGDFMMDAQRATGKAVTSEAEAAIDRSVDDFMELIIPSMDGGNAHISYGRPRIKLDESYSEVMEDGVILHLDELMENGIEENTARYAQKILGGAEVRNGIKAVFGDANTSYADMEARIVKEAKASGEAHKVDFYKAVLSHTYRSLTGQAIYNKTALKWAQGATALNHSTLGMVLGFAQIPELMNIISRTSFKAAIQQFDFHDIRQVFLMGVRDLANKKKTGKQGMGLVDEANDLSAVIETWTGIGGDYGRNDHFMHIMDDMAFDTDAAHKGAVGNFLEKGRQFASLNPMGIMPMDLFMRRWAARASFQHFVNTAYAVDGAGTAILKDSWWKQSAKRFAQIGMSPDEVNRISRVLRDPELIEFQGGVLGGKVKNIRLDKVKPEDRGIVDTFVMTLRRHTDSMIQRQTYGETPEWVNTTVGKFISQFRVFSIVAKSKQLAAGVARADAVEAGNVVGGTSLAILGYMGISYYRALGHNDPEAYLKEKFTDENLMKAAIVRFGPSTIIPMMTDLGSGLIRGKGVFDDDLRTTGLAMAPILGSTTGRLLSNAPSQIASLGQLVRQGGSTSDMTPNELRSLQTLPWPLKIPGVDQLINSMFINKHSDQ